MVITTFLPVSSRHAAFIAVLPLLQLVVSRPEDVAMKHRRGVGTGRTIARMGAEPVPIDEFTRQQQTLTGRFPLQVETAQQVAGQVATARLLGLDEAAKAH